MGFVPDSPIYSGVRRPCWKSPASYSWAVWLFRESLSALWASAALAAETNWQQHLCVVSEKKKKTAACERSLLGLQHPESLTVVSDSLWSHGLQPVWLTVHGILQARILEWVAITLRICKVLRVRRNGGQFPTCYLLLGTLSPPLPTLVSSYVTWR